MTVRVPSGGPAAGNLVRNDPETLARMGWDGCDHHHCLPTCNLIETHCGRLAIFLKQHLAAADGESAADRTATNDELT